jgi:hypothetical protein
MIKAVAPANSSGAHKAASASIDGCATGGTRAKESIVPQTPQPWTCMRTIRKRSSVIVTR